MSEEPCPPVTDEIAAHSRKGRGAVSNRPSARFDTPDQVEVDDGWMRDDEDALDSRSQTVLGVDAARSIITYNDSPDVRFDRSINPYKGCEHGCIYCFARPTHAYLGLSPGLDFETRIFRKPDAPALLRKELADRHYRPAVIQLGINTDAYQPTERKERLTRRILEVLSEFGHPVAILTRSALIQRDIDIIAPMAARGLVKTGVSVTTLDRDLARTMEPRAASPAKRLETIKTLSAGRHPRHHHVGTGHPGPNLPRARGDPRGWGGGRGGTRRHDHPAAALRDQDAVRGVAARSSAGPCGAGTQAHPAVQVGQAQPVRVRRSPERYGPLCRTHSAAVRPGDQALRAGFPPQGARYRPSSGARPSR